MAKAGKRGVTTVAETEPKAGSFRAGSDVGRTIYIGASGKPIDLLAPTPADIDFHMIAEQLAKMARYNGGTPGAVFSVAQHCAIGADAVWAETGNAEAAAYFALHDAHEAYLGDDTTPKKRALEAIARSEFGALADVVLGAFRELTGRFDLAIHGAAGLAWPMPPAIAAVVERMDRRMLLTEWRDLMPKVALPGAHDGDPAPLPGLVRPVKWWVAFEQLSQAFHRWLPALL